MLQWKKMIDSWAVFTTECWLLGQKVNTSFALQLKLFLQFPAPKLHHPYPVVLWLYTAYFEEKSQSVYGKIFSLLILKEWLSHNHSLSISFWAGLKLQ